MRYGELNRQIEGLSKKMLTQTLRQLERDGFVRRDVTPSVPPTVDYSLTTLGRTLIVPLKQMTQCAKDYYGQVDEARAEFDNCEEST